MNQLAAHQKVLDAVEPWAGDVPEGFLVDFVGTLTDVEFRLDWGATRTMAKARHERPETPRIVEGMNGEGWFEAVNWVEAAREASGTFTAITLGACYGNQAVGAAKAVQRLNPMPVRLAFVEPEPTNCLWIERHLRDNGFDPADHWILRAAIDDKGDPVAFPVGAPGAGAQAIANPERLFRRLSRWGGAKRALRSLIFENRTGLVRPLIPGYDWQIEFRMVSAVTLPEVLGPLDRIDYLEADVQGAETVIFPPNLDLLARKVRRIHLGTHGADDHARLHRLFADAGWEIVFSYPPNATHASELGSFVTNDGILTVLNPRG